MSRTHRITGLLVTVLFLASAVTMVAFRGRITDQVKFWAYTPSSSIAALAERSGMSDEGKFYFYVTHPKLESATEFNDDCRQDESVNPVLGCYVSTTDTIHIYNVTNNNLDGIREVTAAHEMLHAAYARLSAPKRQELTGQLTEVYERTKTPELEQRMAFYSSQGGEDTVVSELYAILPTELTNIGSDLEAHYQTYFADRQKVVQLHASYSRAFESLAQEIKTLSSELESKRKDIENKEAALEADVKTMNNKIESFNERALNGGFTSQDEFDAERAPLVTQQAELTARRQAIEQVVQEYNQNVARLNDLGVKMEELTQSIDSMQKLGE